MSERFFLTRHGLSEHNLRTEVYMGRSPESRLVAQGREEARRLGARLAGEAHIGRIVASSLPRTLETARVVGEQVGTAVIDEEDAFWELSKGDWEGVMPRTNLPVPVERALRADPFGFRYPNGESYRDVVARVAPAFDAWLRNGAGRETLFVLHGDVMRAVLFHLLRFAEEKIGDFVIHPCSITEFMILGGSCHLVRFNDDHHLR